MRLSATLLILAAGVALSALIWAWSGGRAFVLILPVIFALPLLWRRGR